MAQAYTKKTHQEVVVKVWGDSFDETIYLNDLVSNNQVLDLNDGYEVNITSVTWFGDAAATVTVYRNEETIFTLPCSQSGNAVDFGGQQLPPDNINNGSDIVVQSTGVAQVYLTLRKKKGYKSTVEYAQYGSYDAEGIIGPQTINGAPPPEGLYDLPIPGSGSYVSTLTVDTSVAGTPYPPGGDLTSISNEVAGLYRTKFLGNFATDVGQTIDVNFCRDTPSYFGKPDTFVGFGQQDLTTENYYTLEWTGYFKAPATGNYNFWVKSDDDTYFWIGPSALAGDNSENNMVANSSNNTDQTNDSLQLTEGNYYPVRIQFGEWGGSEHMQIFWALEGDDFAWAPTAEGQPTVWYHDSVAKGIA